MQPTFAAFNFKSSSNDEDGPSPNTSEKNIDACRFPTSMDPPPFPPPPPPPQKKKKKKKKKCFHPHGLASLTCLGSTRKEERCMKLVIKICI